MTDQLIAEIEDIIIRNLIYNEKYIRAVIPFLKDEYFIDSIQRNIFHEIWDYLEKYNARPTKEALIIEIEKRENISQDNFEEIIKLLNFLHETKNETVDEEWLLDSTEKFCQKRALHNALRSSIQIISGENKKHDEGEIPEMLSDALGISFDSNIGHDYIEKANDRWDFYNHKEKRLPFDLKYLNRITKGGVPKKTLNIIMGGTGSFKTGTLCHFSSHYLMMGENVLYITMEMAEERIAERIDANLLNIDLDELKNIPKSLYKKKVETLKNTTVGNLIIKEYPTASVHVGHFRHLLKELRLKKQFKPDVILIDYINICTSSRLRGNTNANSYTIVKMIAEEIRGLAVEFDVPIWSATQINRAGFKSSDVGLEDTAESFGLPFTSDLYLVIISNDELDDLGQLMFKQLKNRYSDVNYCKRFIIGVNKSKMRLYDVDESEQKGIVDAGKKKKSDAELPNTSNKKERDFSKLIS